MAHEERDNDPEILPPDEAVGQNVGGEESQVVAQILAQVSNYTDRPDLLVAELEKHDPGFVKRMNRKAEEAASESQQARYNFSKIQAYTGLAVSVIAALATLFMLYVAVKEDGGFWVILPLIFMFAVSQSGSTGIARIAQLLAEGIGSRNRPRDD